MDEAAAAARFETARSVADAILYEGYLLYPYRRSSAKNRIRWQFGVLTPPAWARAHGLDDDGVAGSAESWRQQTECLLDAGDRATLHLRLRFLQLLRRRPEALTADGTFHPVGRLDLGGRSELSFDEAAPREFDVAVPLADLLAGERRVQVEAPAGCELEPLADQQGRLAGRVRRSRLAVRAAVTLSASPCQPAAGPDGGGPDGTAVRLRISVENTGEQVAADAGRDEALAVSLLAAHVLAAVEHGAFVSLLDPPGWAAPLAAGCANVHTFPVLIGSPDRRDLVLSSPILLYDYPQVAPESAGDLHDATEIDEILSLRALTLTETEKREARATDPRAAQILDMAEGMTPAALARLHGTIRFRGADGADPGARAVGTDDDRYGDTVRVAGVRLARGSRVRLRPRGRGADAQDMFLDGRSARVEAVMTDLDGERALAVTLDDDPGAELNQWYGRFRYFSPEEVEPLEQPPGPRLF